MASKTLTGTYNDGYRLDPAYQSLTVAKSAVIRGSGLTTSAGQSPSILNLGTIQNTTQGNGVSLDGGGMLDNGSSSNTNAVIEGTTAVYATGGYATIRNAAAFKSDSVQTVADYSYGDYKKTTTTTASVVLTAGGSVNNIATASSISNGVKISGGAATVINRGTIGGVETTTYDTRGHIHTDRFGYSLDLRNGGSINNGSNGTTSADIANGVYVSGGAGSLTNNGKIGSTTYSYRGNYGHLMSTKGPSIVFRDGGSVTNGTRQNSSATIANGVSVSGGVGTITNLGKIGGSVSQYGYGSYYGEAGDFSVTTTGPSVTFASGGSVVNGSSSLISASLDAGISISGGRGTVDNFGTIGSGGRSFYAMYSSGDGGNRRRHDDPGGSVTNAASGTINGVAISGGFASVITTARSRVRRRHPIDMVTARRRRSPCRSTSGKAEPSSTAKRMHRPRSPTACRFPAGSARSSTTVR